MILTFFLPSWHFIFGNTSFFFSPPFILPVFFFPVSCSPALHKSSPCPHVCFLTFIHWGIALLLGLWAAQALTLKGLKKMLLGRLERSERRCLCWSKKCTGWWGRLYNQTLAKSLSSGKDKDVIWSWVAKPSWCGLRCSYLGECVHDDWNVGNNVTWLTKSIWLKSDTLFLFLISLLFIVLLLILLVWDDVLS